MPAKRRPRKSVEQLSATAKNKKKVFVHNEEIDSASDSESAETGNKRRFGVIDENEVEETAHEKRYRIAKQVLEQAQADVAEKAAAHSEVDIDAVAHRLEEEAPDAYYPPQRSIADSLMLPEQSEVRYLKVKTLSPTCVAVSADGRKVACGTKKGSIILWDTETAATLRHIKPCSVGAVHAGHDYVTTMAVTSDDKFLCTGGKDGRINIWDLQSMEHLKVFQNPSSVNGLACRVGHHQLFSCFADGLVKMYTLDEMGFMDSMYGHTSAVQDIDCLARERTITCGGRDHSIRVWKVAEDSQLLYNAETYHWDSIDCVRLINENHFIAATSSRKLSLWSVLKKSPLFVFDDAHSNVQGREGWISSLCTVRHTDLLMSGSNDGLIKFWKFNETRQMLNIVDKLPQAGFINALSCVSDGSLLVAAIGQEHKNGRWWHITDNVKNCILLAPLRYGRD